MFRYSKNFSFFDLLSLKHLTKYCLVAEPNSEGWGANFIEKFKCILSQNKTKQTTLESVWLNFGESAQTMLSQREDAPSPWFDDKKRPSKKKFLLACSPIHIPILNFQG